VRSADDSVGDVDRDLVKVSPTTNSRVLVNSDSDALPLWLQQQLDRSIAKHLEKGFYSTCFCELLALLVDRFTYLLAVRRIYYPRESEGICFFHRPCVGPGYPLSAFAPPLSIHFPIFCSLLPFSFFLFSSTLLIFFYCPSDPFLPGSSHSVSRLEVVEGDRTWV